MAKESLGLASSSLLQWRWSADGMPPQNGLGNDHRCTAVGTNKGWPHQVRRSVNSNLGGDGDKRCHVEQFSGCSELLLAPIVGGIVARVGNPRGAVGSGPWVLGD